MMRLSLGHAGAWLALATCGFLGVAGALVAGVWLPQGWAAAVGGAVTACTAVMSGRTQEWLDQHTQLRRELLVGVEGWGRDGSLPQVIDFDDAVRLGAHPVRSVSGTGLLRSSGALPAYIPRSVDDEVRIAMRTEKFLVVVGESTAGKTRTTFEGMRAILPQHALAVPRNRAAIGQLTAYLAGADQPAALWLDDLERFLGIGGLTPSVLQQLNEQAGTIVLATMRTSKYEQFTSRSQPGVDDEGRAAWRAAQEVLRTARIILLNRLWTAGELHGATAFSADTRIASALRQASTFGLAEVLTAGPELVHDWQRAWAAGAHPRGAALVAAAVDCRRIGLDEPVSRELLEVLHHHYLSVRGGDTLRPEPLAAAWSWALQPVHGASSLIIPIGSGDREPRYTAFDYLIDRPEHEAVPAETWRTAASQADPDQASRIAGKAYWHVRSAFHIAVANGVLTDVFSHSSALADQGKYEQAIALLLEERRQEEETPSDNRSRLNTLRHNVAFYMMLGGRAEEAEVLFREILAEYSATLPADDESLQVVKHNIASCARRRGDLVGALEQFRQILTDRERYLGPTAMNTLDTRRTIARLVCQLGAPVEGLRQLREILAAEIQHLGPDHTNVLESRYAVAESLAFSGDFPAAVQAVDECLPDMVRAYGPDHLEVLTARWEKARYLAACALRAHAISEFEEVLATRERLQGSGHPDVESARRELESYRAADPRRPATAHDDRPTAPWAADPGA